MFNAENLNLKVNNSLLNYQLPLKHSCIFVSMTRKHLIYFIHGILIFLVISNLNYSQSILPTENIRSPLDGTLDISGTFCEIRSNHFHTGVDLRTGGVEGKPVYAIADGYVSRININTYGYGNAVYITHPNGLTSVYAHLSAFNPAIHAVLREKQYQLRSWEVDFKPDSNLLNVKKGDVIAYSGNSGGSLGPHLHFEIRRTETEEWINPLLLNLPYKDSKAPQFKRLRVYVSNDSLLHERTYKDYTLKLFSSGNYGVADGSPVKASGFVGFGVDVQDFQDLSGFRNDIHQMKLIVNRQVIYHIQFDSIPITHARYVNAHTDYQEYMVNNKRIHRAFQLVNLPLTNYLQLINRGILSSSVKKTIPITIEISDFKGNKAKLVFDLHIEPSGKAVTHSHQHINCQLSHFISLSPVTVRISEGTFYEDVDVEFKLYDTLNVYKLPYLRLGNVYTPVHKEIDIEVELNTIPDAWEDKLVLIQFNYKNKPKAYELRHQNQTYYARIKDLGLFTLWPDVKAPVIYGGNMKDSSSLSINTTLEIKVEDNLSGIRKFDCYMDDEWFLMEYDYKKNLLFHKAEGRVTPGWHRFLIQVEDIVGNKSSYTCSIFFK